MKFSETIKKIRTELKLSRKQFADKLSLSRWVIYRWESGNIKNPSLLAIYRIKKVCDEHNIEFNYKLNHIKEIRARLSLNQKEFCKLISGSPGRFKVCCWENDKGMFDLKEALSIVAIAKKVGYDITVEDLVANADKMVRKNK